MKFGELFAMGNQIFEYEPEELGGQIGKMNLEWQAEEVSRIINEYNKNYQSCKYCSQDRMIGKGTTYFGDKGMIACINSNDEFVVNIEGLQMQIPIKYCPFCGSLK